VIYGGQFGDDDWRRIDITIDTPQLDSRNAPIDRVEAAPISCPAFWGEHVGTLWIDDVSLTEVGPRLRPVKVTKLVVTNVDGYEPRGSDGREAFAFPPTSKITVAGLRQTACTPNSITLTWDEGRRGTRGYNVYANTGPDCPTRKYFQRASVWGKTGVTIEGLAPATRYTVKVTAINEDGLNGPAASLRAATARNEPDRE
jgi:hypothetical protein